MKCARSATFLALAAIMACAACGSFGSDGAAADAGGGDAGGGDAGDAVAACAAETCADAGSSCFFDDFGAACRPEITFSSGDKASPDVVGECKNGKLRVAAINTLDMTAHVSVDTPDTYDKIRISTTLAVAKWDRGPVVLLTVDGAPVGELDFAEDKTGPSFTLCGASSANCASQPFVATAGTGHRFTFEITSTSVSLSVDCKPIATLAVAVKLGPRATVELVFGKNDAIAIDGTLDDVSISFP